MHQLPVNQEQLEKTLFTDSPLAEVLLAEVNQTAVGFALIYPTFSSFLGFFGVFSVFFLFRVLKRFVQGRRGGGRMRSNITWSVFMHRVVAKSPRVPEQVE